MNNLRLFNSKVRLVLGPGNLRDYGYFSNFLAKATCHRDQGNFKPSIFIEYNLQCKSSRV